MYDYVVIGAGICGCSVAHEFSKDSSNILLIDKNNDVAYGASGAAGAFLSPLLGKPNPFKDLVNEALVYARDYYNSITPQHITNCGTLRIPKNENDKEKFITYKPYIDFDYEEIDGGYFFPIGSVVDGYNVCKELTKNIEKKLNYFVTNIEYLDDYWLINKEIQTKTLILTTGVDISLLKKQYINLRPVWGQRIDITTSTKLNHNFHKECSVSVSLKKEDKNIVSIGATHHRFVDSKEISAEDSSILLQKAQDIVALENIELIKEYAGARACSADYFPMLGEIIDEKTTLEKFPHMKHGSFVDSSKFSHHKNIYLLNGVGGRGFVLAPLLAKILFKNLINEKKIPENLQLNRFFNRWVKKHK